MTLGRTLMRGCLIVAAVWLVGFEIPTLSHERAAAQTSRRGLEVAEASIRDLQQALDEGRVTSVELVDAYLARIDAYDQRGPTLNSIILINRNARDRAQELDRERATRGARGPLHGIPVLLKDNYDTADMPTAGGTIALAVHVPPDDGYLVRRLREAGVIILAKTNLHELAMGITSVGSIHGLTRNPYAPRRNPGGSSGGTGAGVAASFGAVGMGSDTCGSIRIPSSHNNLVGLRGTMGISSRDGIIPLSHTQDIGGPLARTVTDLALVLDATVGPDPADAITQTNAGRLASSFVDGLDAGALDGARIGILEVLFGDAREDRAVADVVRAALDRMGELGADVEAVEIEDFDDLLENSSVIAHELKFDLIDYLAGSPGAPVKSLDDIIELGLYDSALERPFRLRNEQEDRDSEAYQAALAKRTVLRRAIESVLEERGLDALAYPTIRRVPALVGDPQFGSNCALSAHSGLPAISMPAGFTEDEIPVGIELIGRSFSDVELVGLAYAFEQATHIRRAPAFTPPLVVGLAPAPVTWEVRANAGAESGVSISLRFTHDVVGSELSYEVRFTGVDAADILFAHLHRGEPGANGPTLHRMLGSGLAAAQGAWSMSPRDVADLMEGRLYFQLHTRAAPLGAARIQLSRP